MNKKPKYRITVKYVGFEPNRHFASAPTEIAYGRISYDGEGRFGEGAMYGKLWVAETYFASQNSEAVWRVQDQPKNIARAIATAIKKFERDRQDEIDKKNRERYLKNAGIPIDAVV